MALGPASISLLGRMIFVPDQDLRAGDGAADVGAVIRASSLGYILILMDSPALV